MHNSFDVIRIPTHGPGDVSGLMALIDSRRLEPSSILAVLGKTEGNGGVNDFTREYAVAALCNALAPHLQLAPRAVEAKIAFVMSGGTEGVLSPHVTVFARSPCCGAAEDGAGEKRLSVGVAHTGDVLFVQVKCPLLTSERIKDASARSKTVAAASGYASMGYSRGASALGVAK